MLVYANTLLVKWREYLKGEESCFPISLHLPVPFHNELGKGLGLVFFPLAAACTVVCDQVGGHCKTASLLQSPELIFLPPKSGDLNALKVATSVCDLGLALVLAQLMQITWGS